MTERASGRKALILFGHGARDPEWARPLARIRDTVATQCPDAQVACAYLEYLSPTLAECAAELVAKGAEELVVLPVFIAQGGHLKRELPELVEHLRRQYPACRISLTEAIGEADRVIAAMAGHASALLAVTGDRAR